MHFRPLRSLSVLTFSSALLLGLATPASAGPKDKEAEKLFKAAIDDDYLNAEFPKAEKKLKDAVTKCGSSGCSDELLGKIHIALGTVYGVGLSKPDDAKKEFILALKHDPKAALDPSLTTPELTKIFADAKAGAGSAKPTPEPKPEPKAPTGDANHTPPKEAPVNTPLPVFVEPSDEVPLSKVTLRYRPFGAKEYKSVEMRKVGKGYGGEIPCADVTTTGDVRYFFAFTGADGEAAGGLGSSKEPFKTTVKNELEGDPPKLPGKKAPEQCKDKGDCPPGFPCEKEGGGPPTKPRGDKGWGSSCDQPEQCKEGLTCLNGTCETDTGPDTPKPDDHNKKRMNLIGLGVQIDVLNLTGAQNVCSGPTATGGNNNYNCFATGTVAQFFGAPVAFKNTNGIQGGVDFAGARILVGYDRQLLRKVGLSLGARLGYAFGGPTSTPNNLVPDGQGHLVPPNLVNGNPPNQSVAKAFSNFHGEVRLSYHLLGSMMDDKKFRPYVFLDGGVAQVNASVPVALCDTNITAADKNGRGCGITGTPTILRNVDAYQVTGLGFFGFGGGTTFGITPLFGLAVEFKFMFMIPTFGFAFAPVIGPVFNF